jgi:osmotically-inducible protein OsmY
MKHAAAILSAAILALSLSACVPVVAAGAGTAVGVAAAKEGGIKQSMTDKAVYLRITDLWAKRSVNMFAKLDLNVNEGRVLVAGSVPSPEMRVEAVRLAWQADGVRQVINEIKVEQGTGVSGYVTDAWITGNIKTRLLLDGDVQSINYNVDTVNSTVYLMGIAQDQTELSRVIGTARNTKFVNNVVSYVRLRGEQPTGMLQPTNGYGFGQGQSPGQGQGFGSTPAVPAPGMTPESSTYGAGGPAPVDAAPLAPPHG